jgi:hypothetical protein
MGILPVGLGYTAKSNLPTLTTPAATLIQNIDEPPARRMQSHITFNQYQHWPEFCFQFCRKTLA